MTAPLFEKFTQKISDEQLRALRTSIQKELKKRRELQNSDIRHSGKYGKGDLVAFSIFVPGKKEKTNLQGIFKCWRKQRAEIHFVEPNNTKKTYFIEPRNITLVSSSSSSSLPTLQIPPPISKNTFLPFNIPPPPPIPPPFMTQTELNNKYRKSLKLPPGPIQIIKETNNQIVKTTIMNEYDVETGKLIRSGVMSSKTIDLVNLVE